MTQPVGGGVKDDKPRAERAIREAALDRTIEDSFPASDPLSTIPDPCGPEQDLTNSPH